MREDETMRVLGLLIGLLLTELVVDTVGPLSAQSPPVLERILTDSKLWGEDAFAPMLSSARNSIPSSSARRAAAGGG